MGRPTMLDIDRIRIDGQTQVRVHLNQDVVDEYAERMQDGDAFRAIDVFFDGSDYWLSDGFHRYHATRKTGGAKISAIVKKGTRKDALWDALTANRNNGLRMTMADKKKAVDMALKHWPMKSDGVIAQHVGVSRNTVIAHRKQVAQIEQPGHRVGVDGKTYPAPQRSATSYFDEDTRGDNEIPLDLSSNGQAATAAGGSADAGGVVRDSSGPSSGTTPLTDQTGRDLGTLNCDKADGIREAFRRRDEITQLMSDISQIKTFALAAAGQGDELFAALNVSAFQADMTNAYRALRAVQPYAVCPYCGGDGCRACGDRGWVGQFVYEQAPADMKTPAATHNS
ncbi:MAG: ParB N-terminal domain-containing protein [Planctomycetes bacterium]|nr:ParB N-terminal domain-containing protein [Planctomycetota bacterium]